MAVGFEMYDDNEPPRLPTARAQHPTAWGGPAGSGSGPRARRRPPRLPADWEQQLRQVLAPLPRPARWLDVLAAVLRAGGDDWMVEFVGRLPEVDYSSVDAVIESCRPQARQREHAPF